MTTNIIYNGWTNRATWLVKLWIDNEQAMYFHWQDEAQNADSSNQLAKDIERYYQDNSPQCSGLFSDLLNTILADVNWHEIAKSLINDSQE